ncbi:SAM-dependent methyltransferase [Nakamurella sp. UYEF19]|uniref:class I SAM-dependent methyltransferase n=1 Tax=Nakamurella sp. UYEF19 TaxID=1756392 RepID=UPI0033982771
MSISQESTFVFDPAIHPRRLNLGCGFDLRDGFLNVDFQDFHGPDLVGDVRDLAMLPSDTFDEIIAIDVLEHLPRSDTAAALTEWARLLRPGGTLELQMPDVVACGRFFVTHDNEADHKQMLGQLFGTQGYTGDFHLAGFSDIILAKALRGAGFHRTVIGTRDGWMLTSLSEFGDLDDVDELDPVTVGWLAGFWDPEFSDSGSWRWCDLRAELMVINHLDHPVTVEVASAIGRSPGSAATVTVTCSTPGIAFMDRVRVQADADAWWSRTLEIAPGPTRLVFATISAPLDVADSRTLGFRLADPTITVVDPVKSTADDESTPATDEAADSTVEHAAH